MPKSKYGDAPWERKPKESAPAYEAFSAYRDMGPERALRAVAQQLGKSRALIERWSRNWGWQDRVRAYDDSIQRDAQAAAYKKAVKALEEMQTRHIKTAVLMQKKAVEALDNMSIDLLSPRDIAQLIKEGLKLERDTREVDPAVVEAQRKEAEGAATSDLADVIMQAWMKRREENGD